MCQITVVNPTHYRHAQLNRAHGAYIHFTSSTANPSSATERCSIQVGRFFQGWINLKPPLVISRMASSWTNPRKRRRGRVPQGVRAGAVSMAMDKGSRRSLGIGGDPQEPEHVLAVEAPCPHGNSLVGQAGSQVAVEEWERSAD